MEELEGTQLGALKALVDGTVADYLKAQKGNKAASVRVRKAMKAVKDQAHAIRNVEMLELRKKD
jgi:hypothetical protein